MLRSDKLGVRLVPVGTLTVVLLREEMLREGVLRGRLIDGVAQDSFQGSNTQSHATCTAITAFEVQLDTEKLPTGLNQNKEIRMYSLADFSCSMNFNIIL